jgi:hypothetical protein
MIAQSCQALVAYFDEPRAALAEPEREDGNDRQRPSGFRFVVSGD